MLAPSSNVPVFGDTKTITLSFWQACRNAETSTPPTFALSNFHEACVSNSAFVLGGGGLSDDLLQLAKKENASNEIARMDFSCFIKLICD